MTPFENCVSLINQSTNLDQLHQAWSIIKIEKLYEDEVLMAIYDLKYIIIGSI